MAQDWYRVSQPSDKFSANQWVGIHHEFTMLALRAGNPPEVALFCNDDHSTAYDYYFSPAAAMLAKDIIARYAGTRCESPIGVVSVTAVVSTHGWESFFRESSE